MVKFSLSYDNPVVIFGNGGLANEIFDWLLSFTNYNVESFYVDPPNPTRSTFPPVYSDLKCLNKEHLFVTAASNPSVKESFHRKALAYGMKPCPPLFFNCTVGISSKARIESNTVIFPNATIASNVTIGTGCTIYYNCSIGHDTRLGNFVTVLPGANISGNVSIGNKVTVGSNACIREKLIIADNVFIGMGSVVVKDILEAGVYIVNPARKEFA